MKKFATISIQTDYTRSELFTATEKILPRSSNCKLTEDTMIVNNICGSSLICTDAMILRVEETKEGFDIRVEAKVSPKKMFWLLLIVAFYTVIIVPILIISYLKQKSNRLKRIEITINQLNSSKFMSDNSPQDSSLANKDISAGRENTAQFGIGAIHDSNKDADADEIDDDVLEENEDDGHMHDEPIQSPKPGESSRGLNILMRAANAVYTQLMEDGADIKRKKSRSSVNTGAELYSGKSAIRWEREWQSLGNLTSLGLSEVPHQLGVFQLRLRGEVVYIGTGPLQERLSLLKKNKYAGEGSKLRKLLTENAKEFSIRAIAVGDEDDDEARRTTNFLQQYFIGRLSPDWNKLFLM